MSGTWLKYLFILTGSLILLYPAFYNDYPLVYSDTGTYVSSGFERYVPYDRPVFYGLLIAIFSLKKSLWFSLFFQSAITSAVLYSFCDLLLETKRYRSHFFLGCIIFLSAYSALPYVTSTVLPDIYTPVTLMLFFILLLKEEESKFGVFIRSIIFCFLAATHFSNIASLLILCLLITGGKFFFRMFPFLRIQKIIRVTLLTISLWILVPVFNSFFGFGFHMTKASSVFIMARLCETGLLKQYLETDQEAAGFKIYKYRDSLPDNASTFLWDQNSVLYKTGGWQENRAEYDGILKRFFTSPKFVVKWLGVMSLQTFFQLVQNRIGAEFIRYQPGGPPIENIARHLPNEAQDISNSKQNRGTLDIDFRVKSQLQNLLIGIGFLVIVLVLLEGGIRTVQGCIGLFTIFFMLANAFVSNAFSMVSDRYNSRLSWIIILIALTLLFDLFAHYVDVKNNKNHVG